MSLEDMRVLVLDCQATGPDPRRDVALEIGWTTTRAADNGELSPVHSHLFKAEGGATIPRHVERLTQLSARDLERGSEPQSIWRQLMEAAADVKAIQACASCPAVIHFARFEIPFLRALHSEYAGSDAFPFDIICTHEVARRLLKDLPRRGLRAVAGFFGHSVPEPRRAHHHVIATVHIWRQFVHLLRTEQAIRTWQELKDWIESTKPSVRSGRSYPMKPSQHLDLPDRPGVYRMKRSNGDLLYVGKTNSLKRRVNSYFQKKSRHSEHILEMLSQARQIDVTITQSALEAALLEADQIKQESPPYNVALRKGSRSLVFFSRDFRFHSPSPDPRFPCGPVPIHEWGSLFTELYDLLEKGRLPEQLTFGPGFERPADEILRAGLQLFYETHSAWFVTGRCIPNLLRLGNHLRVQQLASTGKEEASEEPVDGADPQTREEPKHEWTPELIVSLIERSSMGLNHQLTRARWFTLLAESTLRWARPGSQPGDSAVLVLESGRPVMWQSVSKKESLPIPKGYRKPELQRKECLDLPTYDRLSVLTRELRRLQTSSRCIEIRLSPSRILKRDRIAAILQLV